MNNCIFLIIFTSAFSTLSVSPLNGETILMGNNPLNIVFKINNILKTRCIFCLSVLWTTFAVLSSFLSTLMVSLCPSPLWLVFLDIDIQLFILFLRVTKAGVSDAYVLAAGNVKVLIVLCII